MAMMMFALAKSCRACRQAFDVNNLAVGVRLNPHFCHEYHGGPSDPIPGLCMTLDYNALLLSNDYLGSLFHLGGTFHVGRESKVLI